MTLFTVTIGRAPWGGGFRSRARQCRGWRAGHSCIKYCFRFDLARSGAAAAAPPRPSDLSAARAAGCHRKLAAERGSHRDTAGTPIRVEPRHHRHGGFGAEVIAGQYPGAAHRKHPSVGEPIWFCVGGSIAALVAGIIVISSAQRVADEAVPSPVLAPSISGVDDPALASDAATGSISSIQSANGPQSPPSKVANAQVEPQVANAQVEIAPVSGPPSAPPQAANAQAETAPVSGPPSPPSQVANAQAGTVPVSGPPSPPPQAASA
jgi:hypothetical protein